MKKTRAYAVKIIEQLLNRQGTLSSLLDQYQAKLSDPRDKALLHELCYGVCRQFWQLDFFYQNLATNNKAKKNTLLQAIVVVGFYQIIYLRIPEHAAVSETVGVCVQLKKPHVKGLVNAVLRRFLREKESWLAAAANDSQAQTRHPQWLINAIEKTYPESAQAIFESNNQLPNVTLRVNLKKISRVGYLQLLQQQQINAIVVNELTSAIYLNQKYDITQLPGYQEGFFSVQDSSAQLAVSLLDLQNDQRVLDACSAPGGKLTHILEQEVNLQACIAIENNPERAKKITENLQRLNLNTKIICHDLLDPTWWDGQLFDRILLDAPCSATGVIKKHPDIKLLLQANDIATLNQQQQAMLNTCWKMLKPGGKLLYATCSILAQENQDIVQGFLEKQKNAQLLPLVSPWPSQASIGLQILPNAKQVGFYYALLGKNS